jgi:MOSC domain-containing protein YiiM
VEGISLQTLLGGKLRVGSTLIEIHDPCPPCDRMETAIGPGAKAALAERGGVCARVLEGGVVRPGDAVEVAT